LNGVEIESQAFSRFVSNVQNCVFGCENSMRKQASKLHGTDSPI